ncbi:dihydrofolate reductase family protein [Nocardioides marmotae]|uniref:dihydrofolate reductase family protein n=1 Tax=Nocardioides marmotae TaxID=2663857 RepID=UPI0012B628CA|nr:dihydrofolate reductase family protein [Nocardioides marmotae]MBC9734394.1 dihydrofolate reductase [Nocardioides marmotae]MTB85494.1 dihydrofolate reductase [Nocardioides marmotae]
MTRTVYYAATTLDGFLADEHDSLDWLLTQPLEEGGMLDYGSFIGGIGALLMGRTTYEWVLAHGAETGEAWSYTQPTWVMTHREDLPAASEQVRFAAGDVREVHGAMVAAAGDKDVWVVGGGDLAGQLADAGLLDEVLLSIAPVTLGAGRPLLPRRLDLRLTSQGRNGAFLCATYDVVGPRAAPA